MNYWLMKSEPGELSIDSLALLPDATVEWFGIRNYLARNFMRDLMHKGDMVYFGTPHARSREFMAWFK